MVSQIDFDQIKFFEKKGSNILDTYNSCTDAGYVPLDASDFISSRLRVKDSELSSRLITEASWTPNSTVWVLDDKDNLSMHISYLGMDPIFNNLKDAYYSFDSIDENDYSNGEYFIRDKKVIDTLANDKDVFHVQNVYDLNLEKSGSVGKLLLDLNHPARANTLEGQIHRRYFGKSEPEFNRNINLLRSCRSMFNKNADFTGEYFLMPDYVRDTLKQNNAKAMARACFVQSMLNASVIVADSPNLGIGVGMFGIPKF